MIELESFVIDKDNNIFCPSCDKQMTKVLMSLVYECVDCQLYIGMDRVQQGIN